MSIYGKTKLFTLMPGTLTLDELRQIARGQVQLVLNKRCHAEIQASCETVDKLLAVGKTIYGINTGFGLLANTVIDTNQLHELQRRLVLSHAVGVGEVLNDEVMRLVLALKINSLARGYSGIRLSVIEALLRLYNAEMYPCVPAKGSVGASGDLAPLAHLAATLLGIGEVRVAGKIMPANKGLAKIDLQPIELGPKEGLALLNGTQVSTALALAGLFAAQDNFAAALVAGGLAVDAAKGSDVSFDERLHQIQCYPGQIVVAAVYRDLLRVSQIRESHRHCDRVQDPYSLRCQPQVMGACLDQMQFVAQRLLIEANAVSDNPLVFAKQNEILSGGNFHAESVAMAADNLAISIAEVGALSERRIALLMDAHLSGLPAFLANKPGVNSGFMVAHVAAAALASENKSLAHPASVDSIPTSANQEDHVSMATFAARRLHEMADNTAGIIAIELLAAAQGVDFHKPLRTSPKLSKAMEMIRSDVSYYEADRYFSPDIAAAKRLVQAGRFRDFISADIFL